MCGFFKGLQTTVSFIPRLLKEGQGNLRGHKTRPDFSDMVFPNSGSNIPFKNYETFVIV